MLDQHRHSSMTTDATSAVTAITVDLDGTLIRYERSPGEVLRTAFETLEIDPLFSVDEYYARYDEFASKCDSMAELRSDCFAALAAENGHDRQLGRDVAAAFREERDQSNVELLPAAARVLDELSRTYRLAVITNGARDAQRRKIDAVDLERWVETTVIAGRDVPPKPDPAPFERAMQALDVDPERVVHVGDSLESDIAGATAAGLDSVWVAGDRTRGRAEKGGYEPTYRVEAIGDLLPVPWEPAAETR